MSAVVIARGQAIRARTSTAWGCGQVDGGARGSRSDASTGVGDHAPVWGDPPMGPPGEWRREGNSRPADVTVGGPDKSEQFGERSSPEVNGAARIGERGVGYALWRAWLASVIDAGCLVPASLADGAR